MPLCAANCHRGRRPTPLERRSGAFAGRSNFSSVLRGANATLRSQLPQRAAPNAAGKTVRSFCRTVKFLLGFAKGECHSAQPFSTEGGGQSRWKDGPELLPEGQISPSLLRGVNASLRSHLAQRAAASAAGKTVRSFCPTVNFLRRFCER
jgi:hypothetical protein